MTPPLTRRDKHAPHFWRALNDEVAERDVAGIVHDLREQHVALNERYTRILPQRLGQISPRKVIERINTFTCETGRALFRWAYTSRIRHFVPAVAKRFGPRTATGRGGEDEASDISVADIVFRKLLRGDQL